MNTYHVKIKAAYNRSGTKIKILETFKFSDATTAAAFASGYAEGLSWIIDLCPGDEIWHDICGNKVIWIKKMPLEKNNTKK